MKANNLRTTLGIAAGGVAGTKVGRDSSESHPLLGALAGAFVGAVTGLFTSDAVNGLRDLAGAAQSRGEVQPDRMPSAEELEFRELRGTLRGGIIVGSLVLALLDTPGVLDAVRRPDHITEDQVRDLFQKNQEVFFALFERHLRQQYAAMNARWPLPDWPLGLSYDQDGSFLEAALKRKLAAF